MFNIHYSKSTGEIVSYGGSEIKKEGYGNLILPEGGNIFSASGQVNKKVRLRDEALVPLPPTLLNYDRAKKLITRAANSPAGNFAELGVYRGGTAWRLLEVANRQNRKLHLFDTFTGIPNKTSMDENNIGDYNDVDLQEVRELLPEAVFHVGIFPETVTEDVQELSFIHSDMDTYESTKSVRHALWERLVKGGVIYFDDIAFEGVKKAIEEDFPDAIYDQDINMLYIVK